MEEYIQLYQITGAGIALVFASFLYSAGGRSGKWKRRFLASLVMATTINVLFLMRGMYHYALLAIYPLQIAAYSLGYSADTTIGKVVRRLICALCACLSGLLCCLLFQGQAWLILPFQVGVAVWSIWLGVKNPVFAPVEEFLICMTLNLGLLAYPFVVLK